MIVFNLLLDIFLTNATIFYSYFFLVNIFNIPYRCYLIIFLTALFIDLFITNTFLLNVLVISLLYFLEKIFCKRVKSLKRNILLNSFNYLVYILSLYLFYNYQNLNMHIFKFLLFNYPLFIIYCLISYKISQKA